MHHFHARHRSPIFYLVAMLPFGYWLDIKGGVRWATLASMGLVTAGAALRCAAVNDAPYSIAMLHVSYILNDIAGPVAMGAVSKIAQEWFAPHERGTATALAAEANALGNAFSFTLGPAFTGDGTSMAGMLRYSWVCLAACLATMAGMLLYFPARPPLPPSRSAYTSQAGEETFNFAAFGTTLRALAVNPNFVILCLSYGVAGGMYSGWSSTLDLNLSSLGYDQSQAGWIGFGGVIAGNVAGVLLGRYMDQFRRHKAVLVAVNAGAAAAAVWFALLVQHGLLPRAVVSLPVVFATATALGLLFGASIPLYFEMAMESTHPLPEGTTLMVMTGLYNFGGLLILFVPVTSASALFNWLFAGTAVALTAALAVVYRDASKRFDVDAGLALEADDAPGEPGFHGGGRAGSDDGDGAKA